MMPYLLGSRKTESYRRSRERVVPIGRLLRIALLAYRDYLFSCAYFGRRRDCLLGGELGARSCGMGGSFALEKAQHHWFGTATDAKPSDPPVRPFPGPTDWGTNLVFVG